jgi:crotonobetainyl-CoA:carnitine CoA-transferase CaiB-like acyl-CoA transferase
VVVDGGDHHRRTGEGNHVDLAQAEAAMHFLTPAVLDWTVNGRVMSRQGNTDPHLAPHGVYPCAGDDRWVAIACQHDPAWTALCDEMGRADLRADAGLAGAAGRLARRDEIDEAVAQWTATLDDHEVEARLQARGVAAHVVQSSRQILADPQLAHRGHFVDLDHPQRRCLVEGSRTRLSRTPARVERRSPLLGEHTEHVLADLLGYDADHIAGLAAAGALD